MDGTEIFSQTLSYLWERGRESASQCPAGR